MPAGQAARTIVECNRAGSKTRQAARSQAASLRLHHANNAMPLTIEDCGRLNAIAIGKMVQHIQLKILQRRTRSDPTEKKPVNRTHTSFSPH